MGATFVPARHLAFDHSWIDAVGTVGNRFTTHLPNHRLKPIEEAQFGGCITFGQTRLEDLKTTFEGQTIDVHFRG